MHKIAEERTDSPPATATRANAVALRDTRPTRGELWRRFAVKALALALLWGVLTEFRLDALVFGVPAVLAGAALVFVMPYSPGARLSLGGTLVFIGWFAVQSVRGAVDVSLRAIAPSMPLRPGFRPYTPRLPEGAPRVMFLNTITLLPGTLSAEVSGEKVMVHMLDTRADLEADLGTLETRIAALFGVSLKDKEVAT